MSEDTSGAPVPGRAPLRRRLLWAASWAVAGVLLVGLVGTGYAYVRLDGNLSGVDINAMLGTDRPEDAPGGSLDILVLGSDSRQGDNARYGEDDGSARSDTAMIFHLDADRRRADVVSIPRDTLVQRPACAVPGGGTTRPAARAMFNESYALGGPACAVKTVETMSGIRMDHYVEVDFTGFEELVDGLGGVEVTTSRAITDAGSRLDLPAGTHTLDGEQALGLVRTRKSLGDGSDLGRIQLQQEFVRALIDRAGDIGVLSDPGGLFALADTATSALTTDSELASVRRLAALAQSLKRVASGDVNLVTLPVSYDPADPNRVLPLPEQTAQVWRALRADRPVPASATEGTAADRTDDPDLLR